MTITEKVRAIFLSTVIVSRRNKKVLVQSEEEGQPMRDTNRDLIERIGGLDKRMTNLQMLLMA